MSGEWERECFLTWQNSLWVMDTPIQPIWMLRR